MGDCIKHVFRTVDVSGTGKISKDVCIDIFKSLAEWRDEELTALFNAVPVDATGLLSYEELVDFLYNGGGKTRVELVLERIAASLNMAGYAATQLFGQSDVDKNGTIDPLELERILVMFQPDISNAEIVSIFELFDKDGSGTIDISEFVESLDAVSKSLAAGEAKKTRRASLDRRKGIQGESTNSDDMKNYKAPSYPKSDETKQKIQAALLANAKMQILGIERMSQADLDEMVMAFKERIVTKDDDVIRQGEEGDSLYVIEEGLFDIYVARPVAGGDTLGEPSHVAIFVPGMIFGELALMYSAPRAATVRCSTPTALVWSLDREPFQMVLRRCGVEMVEAYNGWLKDVEILKMLNLHEISLLADTCESVLLEEGEVIIQQGDEGDAFFILEEGKCEAISEQDGTCKLVKTYEEQGDYFGEVALLSSGARKYTVKAAADAVVCKIGKEEFQKLPAAVLERLKARADEYLAVV